MFRGGGLYCLDTNKKYALPDAVILHTPARTRIEGLSLYMGYEGPTPFWASDRN